MKHILLFLILLMNLNAQIYIAQGTGTDENIAIEDAKQKALINYVNDAKNRLEACKYLEIEQDIDKFEIVQLKISNKILDHNNQITLQSQFDITPKEKNFKIELENYCKTQKRKQEEEKKWDKDVATVISRIYYGLGGYVAGDSLGLQAFLEYNLNDYMNLQSSQSLYLNLGYDSRTVGGEDEDVTYKFSAYTVGISYRHSFIKVGYDFVLSSKLDVPNAKQATSSYSWGFVLPAKTFEFGVIFKNFNDLYKTQTGGMYVNVKF